MKHLDYQYNYLADRKISDLKKFIGKINWKSLYSSKIKSRVQAKSLIGFTSLFVSSPLLYDYEDSHSEAMEALGNFKEFSTPPINNSRSNNSVSSTSKRKQWLASITPAKTRELLPCFQFGIKVTPIVVTKKSGRRHTKIMHQDSKVI